MSFENSGLSKEALAFLKGIDTDSNSEEEPTDDSYFSYGKRF